MTSPVLDILLRGTKLSPLQLPGLALWLDASQGVYSGGAAQFVAASNQYLSIADNAALSAGVGVDIWGAAWVNLDSKTTRRGVMVKSDSVGTNNTFEYGLTYESSPDRFEFTVGQGTGTIGLVDASTLGSPSIGTWYLLVWGYRAGVGLYLSANGGTFNTAAFTTGVFDGTNPFWIGRAYGNYMDGRIDAVAFGKSPPGGLTVQLLTTIRDRLYNGGNGIRYGDLSGAEKTAYGLVSWWDLEEQSGNRVDSHGSNTMTQNNSVLGAIGIAASVAVDGDPIRTWPDLSGNSNHATQGTASKRPMLKAGIVNGQPVVRFDGVDDRLTFVDLLPASPIGVTAIIVASKTGSGEINNTRYSAMISFKNLWSISAGGLGHAGALSLVRNNANPHGTTGFTAGDGVLRLYSFMTDGTNDQIYSNGIDCMGAASNEGGWPSSAAIGSPDGTFYMTMDVAEIIVCSRVITTTQRKQVERYLGAKYGIAVP